MSGAQRLTFCSYFQRSPRAHHIDQGVIQRDATGTSLPGVHIVASPDDSSPEIWQNKAGRVAGSGRATPVNQCHGNQREPEREPSKGSLREATKDIFAWLPKQKSDSFSETCVPLFGKRNKNEEPDCSSLAALVARDLRQTETNEEPQVLPGVTSPSFWKKANWKT
ncbi:hypothetical protein TGPRC2_244710 [Toxoplasma gondii TgCatPRC2]|uniref:Uncharacterized protein n=12 Tax=Toxoplasma gondii TaxID=5811 RepID=A0A125YLQ4_TOXGV|nr:hypothetical protein TGME49_244710 [Toxoplasma gondii ME49]EPR60702.1 hypothetical protein TGGT1_244710 [Toxoplasma gondii GT1]ESS31716.1 hypothetical protein TGVEG_244710 [Toxoplasma gondii VEG]KAF4643108.1 hypothetical protein TGRH88_027750 [Toxoplasma gondii]KFG34499.1 hypothetical protein TGP89_244710 [Toxoplasma gondii p89]KFG36498.1 hypothetical protein TGDOM2_244710 [Toxoplasma gondii GAB2-2007-GAL-DOM2]KFG51653.1 hypothetical protein TGFOU_244710 [Toxoplasma gondii FOU]KFH04605.1 |eukprot:XP_018637563.1 hypothetical protein TGME49_244710 [Toxoplasma gondii ME49]